MPPTRRRWFDIPLRASLVAVNVAIVVTLSSHVGPAVTGQLAVFPIVMTSLMLIFQQSGLNVRLGALDEGLKGPAKLALPDGTALVIATHDRRVLDAVDSTIEMRAAP